MDNNLLEILQPITLAHLVVDLEEAQDDWKYYPETAPGEEVRAALLAQLDNLRVVGTKRAHAEGLDFALLLEQVREQRAQQTDFQAQRNRQSRDNWFSDYA